MSPLYIAAEGVEALPFVVVRRIGARNMRAEAVAASFGVCAEAASFGVSLRIGRKQQERRIRQGFPDAKPLEQPVRGGAEAATARFDKRPIFWAAGLIALASSTSAAALYWDNGAHFESTDDAFVAARQFSDAPKASGYITSIPVTDNQHVAADDVNARIDDRDYRVALARAEAQVQASDFGVRNVDRQTVTPPPGSTPRPSP